MLTWQQINLKSKKRVVDQGFLTIEIIVAILIAFGFLMFSLQALVLGMMMKVQAQESQRANQLIQEDIERISDLAAGIAVDSSKCNPGTYSAGYAKELWDDLVADAPTVTKKLLKTVESDGSVNNEGTTLTLTRTHVSDSDSAFPHRTIKVNYQVTNSDGDLIANRYVEVIPDVALECP